MGTQYTHFDLEERCRLRVLMETGLGISEIARRLGHDRATIHQEIEREHCVEGYISGSPEPRAWANKLRESSQLQGGRVSY